MTIVIKVCVYIASSPWIGHRGSPTSTLDNTSTTTTTTTTTTMPAGFRYSLSSLIQSVQNGVKQRAKLTRRVR